MTVSADSRRGHVLAWVVATAQPAFADYQPGMRPDIDFITHENVAVTVPTLTNPGSEPTTRTLTVSSPIATMPAVLGSELTGTVTARYGLTTITPRLSGEPAGGSRTPPPTAGH